MFSKLSTISWVFKKKSSPTAAVIVAFTVFEIKKNQKFYETRIYFLYNDSRL